MKLCTFHPSSKNEKSPSRENFLYFRKQKPQKISYVFSKENCSYISGNGSPDGKLQSLKIKQKEPAQSSLL